jgi:large subunit ribosomal protein L10
MNRDQKTAVVDEIAGELQEAEAIFAVDYRGITVSQVADLRVKLRDADARFRVVKNSLSERAADKAGLDTLKPMLVGPTALAFVKGDAAMAAKALNDAARQLNLLDFKGGVLNGTTLTADDVRSIARLPSREVLYAQLVATVAAPLTGLARGLNALVGGLAIQLQAIADQGLVSGEAPAPAAAAEPEAEAPAAEPEAEAPAAEPEAEAPAAEPEAEAPAAEPEAEAPAAEPEASENTETEAASDAATSDE